MAFNRDSSLDIAAWHGVLERRGVSTAPRSGSWMTLAIKRVLTWLRYQGARFSQGYLARHRGTGLAVFPTAPRSGSLMSRQRSSAGLRSRDQGTRFRQGYRPWSGKLEWWGLRRHHALVRGPSGVNQARAYVAATRARDSAKDIALGAGSWNGGVSDGTTLWFVKGGPTTSIIAYLASDQSRQSADDITHADLAGSLFGGVYANGIAWFVEPDEDTAIAFVQDVSQIYVGSSKVTKVYVGSTEVDRIYVGSSRVF